LDKKFEHSTLSFSCLQIVSISTAPVRLPACTSSCALAQSCNGRTFWIGQTNAPAAKALWSFSMAVARAFSGRR